MFEAFLFRPLQKVRGRSNVWVNWRVPRHSRCKAIVLLRCHRSHECHITDHSIFKWAVRRVSCLESQIKQENIRNRKRNISEVLSKQPWTRDLFENYSPCPCCGFNRMLLLGKRMTIFITWIWHRDYHLVLTWINTWRLYDMNDLIKLQLKDVTDSVLNHA